MILFSAIMVSMMAAMVVVAVAVHRPSRLLANESDLITLRTPCFDFFYEVRCPVPEVSEHLGMKEINVV